MNEEPTNDGPLLREEFDAIGKRALFGDATDEDVRRLLVGVGHLWRAINAYRETHEAFDSGQLWAARPEQARALWESIETKRRELFDLAEPREEGEP